MRRAAGKESFDLARFEQLFHQGRQAGCEREHAELFKGGRAFPIPTRKDD